MNCVSYDMRVYIPLLVRLCYFPGLTLHFRVTGACVSSDHGHDCTS